ncbi:MAG TPA: hypothetical protein VFO35_10780 [Steroidobacteraceae bacterium]|nr:hypothetical protein [Steroidobacteraceae bacterium]
MRAIPVIAVCCITLLMASVAGAAQKFRPAPGCKRESKLAELEASLKGEKKVPYDAAVQPLERCNAVQPKPAAELKRTGEPLIAIIVFDVTGSGRVVNQQVIGQTSLWAKQSQDALAQTLYAPLIESDIGVTRVGARIAFVLEFQGRGQSCGQVPPRTGVNFEVRICASR